MRQHQLSEGPLLDLNGSLSEAGYHTKLIKSYDKNLIKTSRLRLKEWDYYYIGNDQYGIALTVADNGYMWLVSVSFFNFEIPMQTTKTKMKFFPKSLNMPTDSSIGDIVFQNKSFSFKFLHEEDKRHLIVDFPDFYKNNPFSCDLVLEKTMEPSMVIATPFSKEGHFYYNQKVNLLKGTGIVKVFNETYDFNQTLGVLDWGRGVWTYHNTWYWATLNTMQDGHRIGFNLGYGFGDLSKATENMFFYDSKMYKLEDVIFDIPKAGKKYNYMKDWHYHDQNGMIDLTFTPIIDRHSATNIIIIKSIQHQVFGKFNGRIKIDEEHIFEIKDLLGFAEHVENKW